MKTIDVLALAAELEGDKPPFIVDVREPHEAALCAIDGSVLIPLGSVPQHIADIPKDRPVVVHCHHGRRSAQAIEYLMTQGFVDIRNLTGGIHEWAVQVDPDMARY